MTRRKAAAIALPALLALLAGVAPSASGNSAQRIEIEVGVAPFDPVSAPFYAQELGLFARAGLDVNLTILTNPGLAQNGVISGQLDFAGAQVGGLAIAEARKAPVRMVAGGAVYRPKAPDAGFVAAPQRRITRASQLVGERVGIDSEVTIAGVALVRWLAQRGVDADDVQLQRATFPDMLALLVRGEIAAAVLPEPYLTQALARGGTRIANVFGAVCPRLCLNTGWMARADVDPSVAARFRTAIQAAGAWANKKENRLRSAAILAKYSKIRPSLIARSTRTTHATRLRPALAQPWIDVYAELGLIPEAFPAIELVR